MCIRDRYHPTYEAGSGGFATVVVAWDTRLDREVAIKCLPLEDAATRALSVEQINAGLNNLQNPYANDESVSIMLDSDFAQQSSIPGLEEARTAALLNLSLIHILGIRKIRKFYHIYYHGDIAFNSFDEANKAYLQSVENINKKVLLYFHKKAPDQANKSVDKLYERHLEEYGITRCV